jgi:hypothetical protein
MTELPWFVRIWKAQRFPPGTWIIDGGTAYLIDGRVDSPRPALNDNAPGVR